MGWGFTQAPIFPKIQGRVNLVAVALRGLAMIGDSPVVALSGACLGLRDNQTRGGEDKSDGENGCLHGELLAGAAVFCAAAVFYAAAVFCAAAVYSGSLAPGHFFHLLLNRSDNPMIAACVAAAQDVGCFANRATYATMSFTMRRSNRFSLGHLILVAFMATVVGCKNSSNVGDHQDGAVDAAQQPDAAQPDAAQQPDSSVVYDLDCPEAQPSLLPDESPRILIVGPSPEVEGLALHLQGMLDGDGAYSDSLVSAVGSASQSETDITVGGVSLMNFFYRPEGRDERLSPLAQPWSHVVLLEDPSFVNVSELYFEGVRVLACNARAVGATPLLLMNWFYLVAPGTPTAGSVRSHEMTYRVGNGTGSVVVPAGYAWDAVGTIGPEAGWGLDNIFLASATLYSTLTDSSAADTEYVPTGMSSERATYLADAALETIRVEAGRVHYETPYEGQVEMRETSSAGELWFMASGSSSERIWYDRMHEVLLRAGLAPQGTDLGYTNSSKLFDEATLDLAAPYFEQQQYQILFARGYTGDANDRFDATTIRSIGAQPDLQVQVWDRHVDSDPSDGIMAIERMEYLLKQKCREARYLGLALIPYHLLFAKLKTMQPSIQLLSDGVHATYPVGYGLATMSLVSRTGIQASVEDLDLDSELAARLAEETIRQLSSLSVTGTFVPDDPSSRPSLR